MENFTTEPYNVTTDFSSGIHICEPLSSTWALGWIFIPILEIILNSFFIFITYRSKSKLRHNFVYAYVISVFTGNLLLGLFSTYALLNYVFLFERYWGSNYPFNVDHKNSSHRPLQLWWSFQRAFVISLYLINNANVSSLIYGIRESSYFIGRSVAHDPKAKDQSSLRDRRNKAVVIITLSWLIPLGFTFAGLFENCIDNCDCVYANYERYDYCQTDTYRKCSRIWEPLTHRFLLSITIMWMIQIVFIILCLVSAIQRWRRANKSRNSTCSPGLSPHIPSKDEKVLSGVSSTSLTTLTVLSPPHPHSPSQENKFNYPFQSSRRKYNCIKRKQICSAAMNPTVKLLIAISISFFVTSLPSMVVILVDVTSEDYVILPFSVTAVIAISLFYGLMVPFILVYYMTSLRTAAASWFLSIKCCTKTTVRSKDVNSVS